MVRSGVFFLCTALSLHGSAALGETVPWGYAEIARAYRIPSDVLYAIAKTESNHRIGKGRYRPWPWTLNVEGRPERFGTRKAAYAALTRYLQQGVTQIDVGLMQINWRWHKKKLGTPWQALDPYHNLRTGAKILLVQYRQTNDWQAAIGRYHAPGNPEVAARYRRLVAKRLQRIRGVE